VKTWFFVTAMTLTLGTPVGALDFAGLQTLVDRPTTGESIMIPAGDYRGELVVRRPLELRGLPGARLIHEPRRPGPTLWIRSPGVRVDGLEILGSGEGSERDHTAVVVSAPGATLSRLTISKAWAGVWIDHGDSAVIQDLSFRGLQDFPFWQRGDAIRISASNGVTLAGANLRFAADGVFVEKSAGVSMTAINVADARYGVHLMFAHQGTASGIATKRTVAGLMVMESADWSVGRSSFTEGYRVGSAGVREIRTKRIQIFDSKIMRQASGIELLDARDGSLRHNLVEENGVAWTWGGDNSGTASSANLHRGNLLDVAGTEFQEPDSGTKDHNHGPSGGSASMLSASAHHTRPAFDQNYWDAWHGLDLDQDGIGDTPYRFDPGEAALAASRPWAGIFLGSPWSSLSQSLPGGDVLDEHPLAKIPQSFNRGN